VRRSAKNENTCNRHARSDRARRPHETTRPGVGYRSQMLSDRQRQRRREERDLYSNPPFTASRHRTPVLSYFAFAAHAGEVYRRV
jgi:hypothetical protein